MTLEMRAALRDIVQAFRLGYLRESRSDNLEYAKKVVEAGERALASHAPAAPEHLRQSDAKVYAAIGQKYQDSVAQSEPVAWRVRGYSQFKTGAPTAWRFYDGAGRPTTNHPQDCDTEPLFTHPQRATLDDETILALAVKHGLGRVLPPLGIRTGDVFYSDAGYRTAELFEFARAVLASPASAEPAVAEARAPYITDDQVTEWADSFIQKAAFNRPAAVQIAVAAAQWVRGQYEPSLNGLSNALRAEIEQPTFMGEPVTHLQRATLSDEEIAALRDEHLPARGETFDVLDCIAFARAVLAAAGVGGKP